MGVVLIPIVAVVLGLTGAAAGASDCACATLSVHIRDGPGASHNILSTLVPPHCVPYKGEQRQSEGLTWAKVNYNGKVSLFPRLTTIREGKLSKYICSVRKTRHRLKSLYKVKHRCSVSQCTSKRVYSKHLGN